MGKELHGGCFTALLEGVVQGHEAANPREIQLMKGVQRKDGSRKAVQVKDGGRKEKRVL